MGNVERVSLFLIRKVQCGRERFCLCVWMLCGGDELYEAVTPDADD